MGNESAVTTVEPRARTQSITRQGSFEKGKFMKRREFIKYGMTGLAAIAVGGLDIPPIFQRQAHAANLNVNLSMEAALVEMIDLSPVFHWVFASPQTGPSFPGPVIFATQGDLITLRVTNNLPEVHGFRIMGTNIQIPAINPGLSKAVRFAVPAAGTYLYVDPLNAPVNRVLGLHGAFIVLPKYPAGTRANPSNRTPYTLPTPNVSRLFRDLGHSPQFPGDQWIAVRPNNVPPNPAMDPALERFLFRSRIWLFHQIDPIFNARVQAGQVISPADIQQNFLPRYFSTSGKTGAFSSHDPNIAPEGNIGEPHLIRMLNAGLQTQSPHIHANHVYVTAVNRVVQKNVVHVDTFGIGPQDTVDWLLPFVRPPDIPGDPNTPLRDLIPQELATVLGTPQSPLEYPMHGHTEIDQTAAGGNYPQGMITHFTITGDLDKVPFPHEIM
jgi:FtsP/CotA-like multicopper oxidase with cupredoxin domain